MIWEGISTVESNAMLIALKVPRAQWFEIRVGVQLMVNAALPILNEHLDSD